MTGKAPYVKVGNQVLTREEFDKCSDADVVRVTRRIATLHERIVALIDADDHDADPEQETRIILGALINVLAQTIMENSNSPEQLRYWFDVIVDNLDKAIAANLLIEAEGAGSA
jgi:hypothetical protein